MRKAVLTAVLLAAASPAWADAPVLSDLDPAGRAERQAEDLRSVEIYRAGLEHLAEHMQARPDLFPGIRLSAPRLLNEQQRADVRGVWKAFLDYSLALHSLERYHADYALTAWRDRAPSFHLARGAFLAQYRFALKFIQSAENDRKLG